ncbi:MAG: hypothetical protein IJ574_01770 [Bacilli bacterium]|nr:hypothetical protein [Bacilli bacterium]
MDKININLDVLNSCASSFLQEKRNYENDEKMFLSTNFYHSANETLCKMSTLLLNDINKIGFAFENISTWWNNYINDVTELENSLVGNNTLINAPISSIAQVVESIHSIEDGIDKFTKQVSSNEDKIRVNTKSLVGFPPSSKDYTSGKFKGNIENVLKARINPGLDFYEKSWSDIISINSVNNSNNGANIISFDSNTNSIGGLMTLTSLTVASPKNMVEQMKMITEGKKIKTSSLLENNYNITKKAKTIMEYKPKYDTGSIMVTHGIGLDLSNWNLEE